MKMCSECGRHGEALYADGSTTIARCALHPKATLYRVYEGRVTFRRGELDGPWLGTIAFAQPPVDLTKIRELAADIPEEGPHSRACGFRSHPHGPACNRNCPTCHGQR